MPDGTYRQLAEAVLVAHQRRDLASCMCGWSDLGKSWAAHVAGVLDAAGALRDRPPPRDVQVTVHPPADTPGFGAGLARGYEEGRRHGRR